MAIDIRPGRLLLLTALTAAVTASICSCSARRAGDMTPTGETVEVVIPDGDIAADSAVAAGDAAGDTIVDLIN